MAQNLPLMPPWASFEPALADNGRIGEAYRFDDIRNSIDLERSVVPMLSRIDVIGFCTIKDDKCSLDVQNPEVNDIYFLCHVAREPARHPLST